MDDSTKAAYTLPQPHRISGSCILRSSRVCVSEVRGRVNTCNIHVESESMSANRCRAPRRNLRNAPEFQSLAADLQERASGSQFDFFPSPGNWGDALLNAGSRQLFTDSGLDWVELPRSALKDIESSEAKKRLAVIGGGGGWNRNWFSTIDFARDVAEKYRDTVVLPSSYDLDLIDGVDFGGGALYTRSLIHPDRGLPFCHDMAFYIDMDFPLSDTLPYPLIAFRRDKERNASSVSPDRNVDLSILGDASTDFRDLLRIVDRFPVVYTDRLHICIAAAMLGRKTFLLDGNYGKNHGVFEASIAENFEQVSMLEWHELKELDLVGMVPIGKPGYSG